MKKTKTVAESSTTWTVWMTSSTRIRFQRSKPATWAKSCGSTAGSAAISRLACSSGVPAQAPDDEVVVDLVVDAVHLLGQPGHQEEHGQPEHHQHGEPQRAEGQVLVICQASALTKRNVTKTSSKGSAREAIGTR